MSDERLPAAPGDDDAQLPAELEQLLAMRAARSGDQPWLRLKVQQQIEAREQAKLWLKDNPGGLIGGGRMLLDRSLAPRLLSILGAAALGGLLGWQLAAVSSFSIPWISNSGAVASVLCALLAALATQLPQLRSMLTD